MKVTIFNYILLAITAILFLVLLFLIYRHRGWERGAWEVGVYHGDDFIQINYLVASSSKNKYKNGRSFPDSSTGTHIKRGNGIYPMTLLHHRSSDEEVYYQYPNNIRIHWLNLNQKQLWYAELNLPDGYWKQVNEKVVYLTIAFEPEGELIVYVGGSRNKREEAMELGRYWGEPDDNARWSDLLHEYQAKELTHEQQIDFCIKAYNCGLEIYRIGIPQWRPEHLSITFMAEPRNIMQFDKSNWEALDKLNLSILRTLNFEADRYQYKVDINQINLFFALEEMEQTCPDERYNLNLALMPDDELEMKLISRQSGTMISVEYDRIRKYYKKENDE